MRPNIRRFVAGEARQAIVAAQPAGCGKFGIRALGLAFEGIGRGEAAANPRCGGHRAAWFFAPRDRLVCARLQQVHQPDLAIKKSNRRIARAQTDGLLDEWDRLLDRSSAELALAEGKQYEHPVAIGRERYFVVGNGLRISALRAEQLALAEMCKTAVRRNSQGLLDQIFCTQHVGRGCASHFIHDPVCKLVG